jgi:hypothetical protein
MRLRNGKHIKKWATRFFRNCRTNFRALQHLQHVPTWVKRSLRKNQNVRYILVLVVVAILVACGGRGGSDTRVSEAPVIVPPRVVPEPVPCSAKEYIDVASGLCIEPLRYEKVTIVNAGLYPHIMSDDGVPLPAINETGYTFGDIPIWGVWFSELKQPNGLLWVLARVTQLENKYAMLTYNPVTNVLKRYEGEVPPGLEFAHYPDGNWMVGPKWVACMRWCGSDSDWGVSPYPDMMYAWAPARIGGYWYVDSNVTREIWHVDEAGNKRRTFFDPEKTGATIMLTFSN